MIESFLPRRVHRLPAKILRTSTNNGGAIIFGLVAGFLIASITGPDRWLHWANNNGPLLRDKNDSYDETVANKLSKEVRVLCWILTTASNHESRAKHVKNTWGRRCNKLLFMSNLQDSVLGSIGLNVSDSHESLWLKTKLAFEYIHKHHLNEYDWFLKADDDTYVIVENLRYMLYQYSTDSPIYFGNQFQIIMPEIDIHQIYMSGGAGYVLSREATRRFVERALTNEKICAASIMGDEDLHLGLCLSRVNVSAVDTRDSAGRGTFFPFEPAAHLVPGPMTVDYWYIKYSVYEVKDGPQCCSDNAISFHYVKPADMYVLDYLIYSLRPFGIVKYAQLPPNNNIHLQHRLKRSTKNWLQSFWQGN